MDTQSVIKNLTAFSNRIGAVELEISKLLQQMFKNANISYQTQNFTSQTPIYKSASLFADGKRVACLPCGLVSGKISSNYNLISSLTSSQKFIDTPNINFNPKSDAICLCNFYFAPALAISRQDLERVMKAKKIEGEVTVSKKLFRSQNILIGNLKNPQNIIFTHYDAYFKGATDNASGVAAVLQLIGANQDLLANNLFVLAGNEELSYDFPIYWGRGYRQFMAMNPSILKKAKKILVVDSVGDGIPQTVTDPAIVKLAFPIGKAEISAKTAIITGNFDALMQVYHGPEDIPGRLKKRHLDQAVELLKKSIV